MLDKLFKYIEDHNIDLNKESWVDTVNGFLNDVKTRKKYSKGNRFEITDSNNRRKFERLFNDLLRKSRIIYDYWGYLTTPAMKKKSCNNISLNGGCAFTVKCGYDILDIKYNEKSNPSEFLDRFLWIYDNYDQVKDDAKLHSFNIFNKPKEMAVEVTTGYSLDKDGNKYIDGEPHLEIIDPDRIQESTEIFKFDEKLRNVG